MKNSNLNIKININRVVIFLLVLVVGFVLVFWFQYQRSLVRFDELLEAGEDIRVVNDQLTLELEFLYDSCS